MVGRCRKLMTLTADGMLLFRFLTSKRANGSSFFLDGRSYVLKAATVMTLHKINNGGQLAESLR